MKELSMHVLDLAQNSIKAGATRIAIDVEETTAADRLTIRIADNGRGMTREQLRQAADPFYTTRRTRRVGLGLSLFQMAARQTGGSFELNSEPQKGTTVTAVFGLRHVDRMPLGDIGGTVADLIYMNPDLDFIFTRTVDDKTFRLDTAQLRQMLDGVALNHPEVREWTLGYIKEQIEQLNGGA